MLCVRPGMLQRRTDGSQLARIVRRRPSVHAWEGFWNFVLDPRPPLQLSWLVLLVDYSFAAYKVIIFSLEVC